MLTNLALRRHLAAAFGARTALPNASLHALNLFAAFGAFFTDFRAFAARVTVMRGSNQHEVGARSAHLGAGHHKLEVYRLNVLATGLKAMTHRYAEAGLVASQALIDAGLHVGRHLVHSTLVL